MSDEREASVADLVSAARHPGVPMASRHAAFAMLVKRFEEMALAAARVASPDPELARDACQAAFLSAWRKLPELRDPAAFGSWLKRLVRTHCARERRRCAGPAAPLALDADLVRDAGPDPAELAERRDRRRRIRRAVDALPEPERAVVTLFHLRGRPLRSVARALGISEARAGKLAYSARLRLRRDLPAALTEAFLSKRPGRAFSGRVRSGSFDEFLGEYRFPARPDHAVIIRREGNTLAGYVGGRRNVLVSRRPDSLEAREFDGEARFRRDKRGRVSHFVYYEFGKRLGVARKVLSFPPGRTESWAEGTPR